MKAPAFYMYLQFKIAEHSDKGSMNKKMVYDLFSYYSIPKKLRPIIIREMEGFRLISDKEDKIKTLNCRFIDELSALNRLSKRRLFAQKVLNTSPSV